MSEHSPTITLPPPHLIAAQVATALAEDLGQGDVSAQLIAADQALTARLITREAGILCGQAWVEETLRQLDPNIRCQWFAAEGERLVPDQLLAELHGPARAILSAERCALNFLQILSGTASQARQYVDAVAGTGVRLLDTRKTLPGLRLAQKYACRCGGFENHRIGLYDQFLIKENHIHAAGSIRLAIAQAQNLYPDLLIEVEVENESQIAEAVNAGAQRVMLDNFDLAQTQQAVKKWGQQIALEASGNISLENIRQIAASGVHFISIGAVTKHLRALDLSLRYQALCYQE